VELELPVPQIQTLTFEAIQEKWQEEIEKRLQLSCANGLLGDMVLFHLGTGGKRLRALLPCWVCHNLGGQAQDALDLGAGLELLHNGTLVHDDLQDGDTTRRGQPTVWKRWGDAQAINAGDAFYFLALIEIAKAKQGLRCVTLASKALVRVIEGQTMEFQLQLPQGSSDRLAPTQKNWEHMARAKTAALFGACTEAGAIAANASNDLVAAFATYGENIGIFFQVQDDYLDLVANKGREQVGTDIAEGKLSFPVTWAYENANAIEAKRLAEIIETPRADTDAGMIGKGLELLAQTGALDATADWLETMHDKLSTGPCAEALPGLTERIMAPVAAAMAKSRAVRGAAS